MKKLLSSSTPLLLAAAVLIAGPVLDVGADPQLRAKPAAKDPAAAELKLLNPPARYDKACVDLAISCNTTVNGVLDTTDCQLDPPDNSRIDFWVFQGDAGTQVTINMTSNDFDTFLFLLTPFSPNSVVFALDDDGGTGTNSRIQTTLDETGEWAIGANGFSEADLGDYTLQLQCSGGGPPQTVPAAPTNLFATPFSTTEVELEWDDNATNESEYRVETRGPGQTGFTDIGSVPANTTRVDVIQLDPMTTYDFRVRARNGAGNSGYSNIATATTFGGPGVCVPSQNSICLLDDRFMVEVDWRDFEDVTGLGTEVFSSEDSTLLYFFDADNWEMLVKMLDACNSPFNSFWVFSAATTNVEYTLTITDTQTGAVKSYFNPLGNAAPAITDTEAFSTCP